MNFQKARRNSFIFATLATALIAGNGLALGVSVDSSKLQASQNVKIDVPESLSLQLHRNRASFRVQMLYSGSTSLDYAGLVAPLEITGSVNQDPAQAFEFLGQGATYHAELVPQGTKVLRFGLRNSLASAEGSNLDLYVYRCEAYTCSLVGNSSNPDTNEDVILTNPEPAADGTVGDFYIAFIHGLDLAGATSTNYTMQVWIADQADSSTRVRMSPRAIEGRFNSVRISTSGLNSEMLYMGGITFYDEEGVAQGTTVLEVQP